MLLQSKSVEIPWGVLTGTGIALFAILVGGILLLRKVFLSSPMRNADPSPSPARKEDASAFMAASMQAVIQKLKEQEKELERLHKEERDRADLTERLSEEVTRNMPAGLIVVNAQSIITSANPAAEQTLGQRGLGFRRFSEALGENSDLSRLISDCLATGKIFRREQIEHLDAAGDIRQLGVTISPIRKSGDDVSGVICLLTDLTELASLQKQMQLKENLAALGELSAGIAHEFKNALATISGYAQMIQAETASPEAADNAEKILEQTRNITKVVTEFLKYARPLDISDEQVALEPVIERVVSEVAEAIPSVRLRFEGPFGVVAGDESFLRQAFLNLTRNAAEACSSAPNGGKIILRSENLQRDGAGYQRITIFDNGPGIPREVLPKLFRPFFTTKPNGTGLGLAVVQKIILQHGGQVEARNREEGGAAFIVTLPLSRRAPEAVELREGATIEKKA
ncbi:MAG TPA: ATP-binding protein [Candidatus Eremiobacteraceae bacterium]|nr:ATP-binding protein [Candidatus Eremiobacteraceae bacterium]